MDLRIYTKEGKVETLTDISSITDDTHYYYISFLDGMGWKVHKAQVGANEIRHPTSKEEQC